MGTTRKKHTSRTFQGVIAIASHERQKLIQKNTLAFLHKHRIPMKQVYVFCSPKSFFSYQTIADEWGFHLIKSKNSIMATRNHIIEYFPNGKPILEMDDDIRDIVITKPPAKRKSLPSLSTFLTSSFRLLKQKKGLWGVNATDNNREESVSGKDQFGAYAIINSFCGYFNDKRIRLTVPEKEDFDRTAQFLSLGLPVLKRGGYGIRTNYWKNPGGIQAHYGFQKRLEVQSKSADLLMKKFPDKFRKQTRKNGIVDIRFIRSRKPLSK